MTGWTLEQLSDRREIEDLLIRYAMSLDARDWATLDTVFLPDAVATLGNYECLNREEIVATCRRALSGLTCSQHIVTNFTATVDGDTATSRCYLHAQHNHLQAFGDPNFIVAGTYADELVRTAEGWRIAKRHLKVIWVDGNAGLMDQAIAAWTESQR